MAKPKVAVKKAKKPAKGKPAAKVVAKPTKASKPAKPTKPSLPLPPPPPAPIVPKVRDEFTAPRDIGRLLRYGEKFATKKIDIRMLPIALPCGGQIAVGDPRVPKSWKTLDRPVGAGVFRTMLAVAKQDASEELAALVIHTGRPPIAKWTVAHFAGQKAPKSADQLPAIAVTGNFLAFVDAGAPPAAFEVPSAPGLGPFEVPLADGRRALAIPCKPGEYTAYWGVDPTDKAVCLVLDLDVFLVKEWKAK